MTVGMKPTREEDVYGWNLRLLAKMAAKWEQKRKGATA
jgi:hypothetical protein